MEGNVFLACKEMADILWEMLFLARKINKVKRAARIYLVHFDSGRTSAVNLLTLNYNFKSEHWWTGGLTSFKQINMNSDISYLLQLFLNIKNVCVCVCVYIYIYIIWRVLFSDLYIRQESQKSHVLFRDENTAAILQHTKRPYLSYTHTSQKQPLQCLV